MKNEDFDNVFSANLPDFSNQRWKGVEQRLEIFDLKKRLKGLLYAIPLLSLLFMGVSGALYYKLGEAEKKMVFFEKQIAENPKKQLNDTIYNHVVMYDTIYKKIVVVPQIVYLQKDNNSNIENQNANELCFSNQNPNNIQNQTENDEKIINKKAGKQFVEKKSNALQSENTPNQKEQLSVIEPIINVPAENSKENKEEFKNNTAEIAKVEAKVEEKREAGTAEEKLVKAEEKSLKVEDLATKPSLINSEKAIQKAKVSFAQMMAPVKPKSLEIGAIGAFQMPLINNSEGGSGSQFGVRGIINYGKRNQIGLVLDFQKSGLRFINDSTDNNGIPDINLGNGEKIKKENVQQFSSYQFGAGLKFSPFKSTQWKPYFGLGWALQIPQNYIVRYEIEDVKGITTELTKTYEGSQPIIRNLLNGNIGVSYKINENFKAIAEIYSQSQLTQFRQTPIVLGSRFGIFYLIK